jgi:hypothetical protein
MSVYMSRSHMQACVYTSSYCFHSCHFFSCSEAGEESLAKLQNLSGLTAEQMEDAERERKAQADKLMQEFLEARRKERSSKS